MNVRELHELIADLNETAPDSSALAELLAQADVIEEERVLAITGGRCAVALVYHVSPAAMVAFARAYDAREYGGMRFAQAFVSAFGIDPGNRLYQSTNRVEVEAELWQTYVTCWKVGGKPHNYVL